MLFVELVILLLCIVVGARFGGIALGTLSGIGLLVFVLVFGMPPGSPPAVVLGMILAVITALSMMEASGGLTLLVEMAEKLLHRHPARITVIAPLVTYALIFAAGTQHVIYSLLPVIAEVSRKAGVRPALPPTKFVETGVARHTVGPRSERGPSVESRQVAHDLDQGLLAGIVAIARAAGDASAHRVDPVVVASQELVERVAITALRSGNQCGVIEVCRNARERNEPLSSRWRSHRDDRGRDWRPYSSRPCRAP